MAEEPAPLTLGIVREGDGKSSQVIVATHSPFVVHGSLTAKHVVLRRDRAARKVVVDPSPAYPGATTAEVAVAAFDLGAFAREARGKRLALVVEGPTRELPNPMRLPPVVEVVRNHVLFDLVQQGYGQWNGTVTPADAEAVAGITTVCQARKRRGVPIWAALLPVPEFRKGYAGPKLGGDSQLTIELLFPDSCVGTVLERVVVAGDGEATRLAARSDAQKKAVAAAAAGFPPEAFAAFEPIFALLDWIVGHAGLAAAAQ